MKRIALIKNGKVDNVIMAGPDFSPPKDNVYLHIESDVASVGDVYERGEFRRAERKFTKEELIKHAKMRHALAIADGVRFDSVDIRLSDFMRSQITELAYIAETHDDDVRLVLPNYEIITLSSKQILELRNRMARHIVRSYAILADIIAGIENDQIVSIKEIDSPESAKVKIDSWLADQ